MANGGGGEWRWLKGLIRMCEKKKKESFRWVGGEWRSWTGWLEYKGVNQRADRRREEGVGAGGCLVGEG